MNTQGKIWIGVLLVFSLAGCVSPEYAPLVFVQAHALGITANASGSQAMPEVTLGYRDVDVALVPVHLGQSITSDGARDAYSVIGQFDAGTAGISGASLGKFFATGLAARNVSLGFKDQLSKNPPPRF